MRTSTHLSVTTRVALDEPERFDVVSTQARGKIRVSRLQIDTDLSGVMTGYGPVVEGIRYRQDGTLGKAPAAGIHLYPSEVRNLPPAILEAVRLSVLAEVAEHAGEATTACTDCGEQVPIVRTGEGDFSLPRCPAASEHHRRTHQDSHRVPRDVFEAEKARLGL